MRVKMNCHQPSLCLAYSASKFYFFFIQVKNSVPVADPETDQNLIPETFKMENGGNIEIVPNFKLR